MADQSTTNPLLWKREHRLALLCAAGLGALAAFLAAAWYLNPEHHVMWAMWCSGIMRGTWCTYLWTGYWLLAALWAAIGAAAAAALVYIGRLMRA